MGKWEQLAGVEINALERNMSAFGKMEDAHLQMQVTPNSTFRYPRKPLSPIHRAEHEDVHCSTICNSKMLVTSEGCSIEELINVVYF